MKDLCIRSEALRSLALALDQLDTWQTSIVEQPLKYERPCLRRLEALDRVRATVTLGPDIGGCNFVLELWPNGNWIVTSPEDL